MCLLTRTQEGSTLIARTCPNSASGEFVMKTLGIIGGTGPESTVEYYRLIMASYRARKRDGSYPSLFIVLGSTHWKSCCQ